MSTLETSDDDFIGSAEDRRKIQNDVLKTFELMVSYICYFICVFSVLILLV